MEPDDPGDGLCTPLLYVLLGFIEFCCLKSIEFWWWWLVMALEGDNSEVEAGLSELFAGPVPPLVVGSCIRAD